jgi:hypothetical protein
MPSYSVRAFVRVRGQDAYRQRTKAEIDAEIRRLAARDQQKRQRVIDDLRRCDEACAEAKPNYCEDLSAVAKRARFWQKAIQWLIEKRALVYCTRNFRCIETIIF